MKHIAFSIQNRNLFMEDDFKVRRVPNLRIPKHSIAVRHRDTLEPSVRWPDGTWDNANQPSSRPVHPNIRPAPQPVKPYMISGPPGASGTRADFDTRSEGFDIGPDIHDPDHETTV